MDCGQTIATDCHGIWGNQKMTSLLLTVETCILVHRGKSKPTCMDSIYTICTGEARVQVSITCKFTNC